MWNRIVLYSAPDDLNVNLSTLSAFHFCDGKSITWSANCFLLDLIGFIKIIFYFFYCSTQQVEVHQSSSAGGPECLSHPQHQICPNATRWSFLCHVGCGDGRGSEGPDMSTHHPIRKEMWVQQANGAKLWTHLEGYHHWVVCPLIVCMFVSPPLFPSPSLFSVPRSLCVSS